MANYTGQKKYKKILGVFLKIAISSIILYFLLSSINISQLSAVLSMVGWTTVGQVFFVGVGLWLVEYLRFYLTTKPILPENNTSTLLGVFFTGYALRFLVPGGHGEVGKMVFVPGKYSQRLIAYLADKGSLAMAVAVGGLAGVWQVYPQLRPYYWILPVIVPVIFLIARYFILKQRVFLSVVQEYPYKKVLSVTIPLAFIHVLIMAVQYWLVLRWVNIPFSTIITTVNVVLIAVMIPISFAGLGVREWTTMQMLRYFEISKETALVAPLLVFICNVFIPALIGVGIILIFKMKPTLLSRNKGNLQ